MAPPRKAKRAGKRAAGKRKAPKRAGARKTKRTAKRTARRTPKRGGKRTAKRGGKRTAKAATASAARPKTVAVSPRKSNVFSTTDLYDHVAKWNPEMGKTQVRQVVDDTLGTVHTAIKKVGKVRLKGIGTISTRRKPAQRGGKMVRNPFTGELVKSKPKPASVRVKLSAAKDLKQV